MAKSYYERVIKPFTESKKRKSKRTGFIYPEFIRASLFKVPGKKVKFEVHSAGGRVWINRGGKRVYLDQKSPRLTWRKW